MSYPARAEGLVNSTSQYGLGGITRWQTQDYPITNLSHITSLSSKSNHTTYLKNLHAYMMSQKIQIMNITGKDNNHKPKNLRLDKPVIYGECTIGLYTPII